MDATTTGEQRTRLENWVALLLFVIHAGLQISLFVTHQPWQDEGQAWYWALALKEPIDFLIVPGEGHPPLWYLVLRLLSLFTDFDHARVLTLVLAIINGALVLRLFRDELGLAALLLLSGFVLHYWGYQFRPYTLVFTLTLLALLYARAGRLQVGAWLLAIACGLHFFAGFLFAFWLILCWRRGLRFSQLLLPALIALGFGITAILSGRGNVDIEVTPLFEGLILSAKVFSAPFALAFAPLLLDAVVVAALIVWLFRRDMPTLATFFAVASLFCLFAAFVYGRYGWHIVFVIALLLMAYATSERKAHHWPFYILLLPGVFLGIAKASYDIRNPTIEEKVYAAIVQDAGNRLDPGKNLVVWPDALILGIAVSTDMPFISGNNGNIGGPVRHADRKEFQVDTDLLPTLPHPYWLFCLYCTPILDAIEKDGRHAVEIYPPDNDDGEPVGAYRIE